MTFLVCMRHHKEHGYLPKIVGSEVEVERLRKYFEENNVDGDFTVEPYDGPISYYSGGGVE